MLFSAQKFDKDTVSGIPFCRKSACLSQSQIFPLSCFSWPIHHLLAQAAYREIFGLAYTRGFSAE